MRVGVMNNTINSRYGPALPVRFRGAVRQGGARFEKAVIPQCR